MKRSFIAAPPAPPRISIAAVAAAKAANVRAVVAERPATTALRFSAPSVQKSKSRSKRSPRSRSGITASRFPKGSGTSAMPLIASISTQPTPRSSTAVRARLSAFLTLVFSRASNTCRPASPGLIVPWNYPLFDGRLESRAGHCAGCAVVLKPSEYTPADRSRVGAVSRPRSVCRMASSTS